MAFNPKSFFRLVKKSLVRKSQPGNSSVHVPAMLGSEERKVEKESMNPPLDNLEAMMINAALGGTTPKPVSKPPVEKDKLTTEGREHIAEHNFAMPAEKKYPIHDISHARNALARSSGKPEEAKVKVAVYRKYPSLKPEVTKEVPPRRVSTVAIKHGDHMLMGKRRDNGKWTVPGGHVDPGEDMHQGALREVEEETGIKLSPDHVKPLTEVDKKLDGKGKPLHVQAFHAKLAEKPSTSMKADPDGEVHRWRWVDVSNGLPDEIEKNLHVPAKHNILMSALGLVGKDAREDKGVLGDHASPDAATSDDTEPRFGVSPYSALPSDALLALDAMGYQWSDATSSGEGNRRFGYPSQGAIVGKEEAVKKTASVKKIPIFKINNAKQIAYGVVIAPEEFDTQDDIMEPDEIEETAHKYLEKSRVIGSSHSKPIAAFPVESYIAPADFDADGQYGPQTVKKGSWCLGVKVVDPKEWAKITSGEYQGFSVGGFGLRDKIS